MSKSAFKSFLLVGASTICLSFILTSCAPRGESKTLQEIFKNESERFEQVYTLKKDQESVKQVQVLSSLLGNLKKTTLETKDSNIEQTGNTSNVSQVVNELDRILPSAGYTSRPALSELRNQYEQIANAGSVNKSALTLLLARTYGLLADELGTVAFQVS